MNYVNFLWDYITPGNQELFIFTNQEKAPGPTGLRKDYNNIKIKMVTKDILRIALFLLFAIFAIWSGSRNKVRNSVQMNKAEEPKQPESKQMIQHLEN